MNENCANCGAEYEIDQQGYAYGDRCVECALDAAYADALYYLTEGRLGFWSDRGWPVRMSGLLDALGFIEFAEGLTMRETIESVRERMLDRL